MRPATLVTLVLFLTCAGCDLFGDSSEPEPVQGLECSIPPQHIHGDCPSGRDCIPALTEPKTVDADSITYLQADSRVVGFTHEGRAYAVPHNILWWHEIVNFNFESRRLALTYCPLTGSSLLYDRAAVDGAEFGVAGFLYRNNLIMYDRRENRSLWPQMSRGGRCGPEIGTELEQVAAVDVRWSGWKELHPDSRVVSRETGHDRNYRFNPYPDGGSDALDAINPGGGIDLPFPMPEPIDERRPPRERVLGIPDGEGGGIAYPFGLLAEGPARQVVADTLAGEPVLVFWSSDDRTATAFHAGNFEDADAFQVVDGRFTDRATESTWTIEGAAVSGPRAGERLEPIARSYIAFWFAWAAFQPETEIWQPR